MSRTTRAILIILVVVLFLCCVAGLGTTLLSTRLVGRLLITDPIRVSEVSDQIANFELPPKCDLLFASNMAGFKMVAIGPTDVQDNFLVIMMMLFPDSLISNRKDLERQMEQALAQQTRTGSVVMETAGQEEVLIRDEPVTMTIREGTTEDGMILRQMSGMFQGVNGPVLLMIMGEKTTWDQTQVTRFLSSIK